MSGTATQAASVDPPLVDFGDPPSTLTRAWHALAPCPGRLGNTIRLVVLVLATASISETFRIPDPALSCFIVLLVSRDHRASTVQTALVSAAAVLLALLLTIVVFMASLGEPALRLPLIAVMTCAAMFATRVSPLGPILFVGGFIIAYGLTLGDEVLGLALQPGIVGNTTDAAVPQLLYLPPEEALVHFLLWLAVAVVLPAGLVILANLLTGRDPAVILRTALASRLTAAGRFCASEPGALPALAALAREGTGELLKLSALSRPPHRQAVDKALIEQMSRLCLALLATAWLPDAIRPNRVMAWASSVCRDAASAVILGSKPGPEAPRPAAPTDPVVHPLVAELCGTLDAIRAILANPAATARPGAAPTDTGSTAAAASSQHRLLTADAFSNPAHLRFALKVTLAVMLCYAIQDLTDWPGIHTCVITCFFVSLGTVGETVHKATLRITGCLIGAALGIGTILLLMPEMTDLGDLLLVLAPVTFLAGWVASGSERIAYAGWQIGLAFYLTVLQGNGPTLDMETARDRIVGIILGNIVVCIIFVAIWPAGVATTLRPALAKALQQLGALLALPPDHDPDAESGLRHAFGTAVEQARGVLVNDTYEILFLPGRRPIDTAVLLEVQALLVPVSVIVGLGRDPEWAAMPEAVHQAIAVHHQAMAAWLDRCAGWVRGGTDGRDVAASLPTPPDAAGWDATGPAAAQLATRMAWYGILHRDMRAILVQVAP